MQNKLSHLFIETYETFSNFEKTVVEINGNTLNGLFTNYTSIFVTSTNALPFEDNSVDIVVCNFQSDPCFWVTFREITRIVSETGYIFSNTPIINSINQWHFYPNVGQALAYWSGMEFNNKSYPVRVVEVFNTISSDETIFVCIWKRVKEQEIHQTLPLTIINTVEQLEAAVNNQRILTRK